MAADAGMINLRKDRSQGNRGKEGQGSALDPPRAERPLDPIT